jgi:hypothetical protein
MTTMRAALLAVLVSSCFAGYGCAGHVTVPPVQTLTAQRSRDPDSSEATSLSFTLRFETPVPAKAPLTDPGPNSMQGDVQSVVVLVNQVRRATVAVGPSAPGCVTQSSGARICSVSVGNPPLGERTVALEGYSTAGGSGSLLASGATTKRIVAGRSNFVTLSVSGVATRLQVTQNKSALQDGFYGRFVLNVNGVDALGEIVRGDPSILNPAGRQIGIFVKPGLSGSLLAEIKTRVSGRLSESAYYTGAILGPKLALTAEVRPAGALPATQFSVPLAPAATGKPGFILENPFVLVQPLIELHLDVVVEYARNASGKASLLRSFLLPAVFIGIDGSGNLYSSDASSYGGGFTFDPACTTCEVWVADPANRPTRALSLPPSSKGAKPRYPFADPAGNIYDAFIDCSAISEFAAGASGKAKPSRMIISIPSAACSPTRFPYDARWPLFADRAGNVYLLGPLHNYGHGGAPPAWFIWSASARGRTPRSRTLASDQISQGVQAVSSDGSAWTTGDSRGEIAIYGPTANGQVSPTRIVQAPNGIVSLALTSSGNIVYVGAHGSGEAVYVIPPAGGAPIQTVVLESTNGYFPIFYNVAF